MNSKDKFVNDIVKMKKWDNIPAKNYIICCGCTGKPGHDISLASLMQAFATIEADDETVDVIVASERIWKTMEWWGYGTAKTAKTKQDGKTKNLELLRSSKYGKGASIWGADIYISKDIPDNVLVIGSKNHKVFAKVELK